MRIAVASLQKEEGGEVSMQAGRSPYFLVYDGEGTLLETIPNPFAVGGGGAGFGVAKMLADKGVTLIVAGKFGGNMEGALQQRGIDWIEFSGTVAEGLGAALNP